MGAADKLLLLPPHWFIRPPTDGTEIKSPLGSLGSPRLRYVPGDKVPFRGFRGEKNGKIPQMS
jgi:hypothetical protein